MAYGSAIRDWDHFGEALEERFGERKELRSGAAMMLYVRDKDSAGLKEKVGAKWEEWQKMTVPTYTLELIDSMHVGEDGRMGPRVLGRSLFRPVDIRVNPKQKVVAYTETQEGERYEVMVVGLGGREAARQVAEDTGAYVDWSPDGLFLVYEEGLGVPAEHVGSGDSQAQRLGTVSREEWCDDFGGLLEQPKGTEVLATVLFRDNFAIHCVANSGQVMFAATPVSLPSKGGVGGEPNMMYICDKQAIREVKVKEGQELLPVGAMAVSPDEKHVAVADFGGKVSVLTVATGEVTEVQGESEGNNEMTRTVPVWRSNDEVCLAVPVKGGATERGSAGATKGKEVTRVAEIVVYSLEKKKSRVISGGWAGEVREGFLSKTVEAETQPSVTGGK